METAHEYAHIVEYCYNAKEKQFVVRFLDTTSYIIKIADLPKKLQTKKPKWEEAKLTKDRSSLAIPVGDNDFRLIPSSIIHSRGVSIF